MLKNKKKIRAQQRKNPTEFEPSTNEYNPPSFERSYLIRILQELLAWKRSVPIGVGIAFLYLQGSGIMMAFGGGFLLWLGTSFLADHVKYMYYFRPVEDGIYKSPDGKTQKDRFLQAAQSYWIANILGICIVWLILI